MSDLFRGRASTWSAGAPTSDHDSDAPRGFHYTDTATATAAAALALRSVTASTSAATTPVDQPSNNNNTGGAGGFHYSPPTATDLGTQEFSTSRRLVADKTPESTTSDYPQNFFANTASSPSHSSRDWNANSGGGGFQSSSFSVLSVSASSPFGHHAEGGGGLLTPCGGGYGSSSPYTNGSCPQPQQQQQPGLHSGSPSSVGSQLSIPQPNLMSAQGAMASTTTAPTTGVGGSTPAAATTGGGTGSAAKRPARRNPWGSETYSDLIAKAIESYPEKQATLQQIYDYISTNYTYFRERSDPPASAGWKNSIRHNLSLHDKFVKCPKASESSKSSYWRLNANSLNRPYVRRRTCSLDTSGSVAGGGGGGVGGKKAKSRLGGGGSGAASSASAAKRAAQIAAAATAAGGGGGGSGGRGEMKSGGALYGGDNLLSTLQSSGSSAAAVRSHLNSLSSGIVSAFSIPGGGGSDTLLGLKPDPGSGLNHHPWTNSGFLADRKPPNDEISALCKMQTSDSVSSGSLSLMSSGGGGGYEFQVPRPPPSSSTRSSFSSSGIGSDRGSSFFSPPPPPLPPQSSRYHHHQAFSQDQQQRYGSLCDASPTAASTSTTPTTTYDHLTGILTGSAECLDGGADPFLRDDPHQLQHHHQPPPPSMSHHHQHHHHHQHPPLPPPTNSHLHNLLMCGDSSGEVPGSALSSTIHGSGEQQQLLSSQDAMELRISLEIANRVKSGEMSSTMQQWAAVAASAARTVENGESYPIPSFLVPIIPRLINLGFVLRAAAAAAREAVNLKMRETPPITKCLCPLPVINERSLIYSTYSTLLSISGNI
ncbi:Forkhead box protein O1-A [Echinococcus granulosus]|uniref:Forkhead box protein O4 n=1 Tax=Echinococcus granulosus TaxID=6210 RepID=A0A068WUM2_ECHGR|nr:Forkhead box protein O1-A [Echinococcus granulosus]CDS21384.1 forkhead box protein O4 [Echinococcus granulosus]